MSEPVKKPAQNPENYSPKDKPEIINKVENAFPGFSAYKNILYRLEFLSLDQSFKFLALPNAGLKPFENIGMFCDKFKSNLPNSTGKDIGVGMYTNLLKNSFDYYFGQQVTSLEQIPEGLVGIDTHTTNFCVMMFIANTMYELVGMTLDLVMLCRPRVNI